MGSHPSTAGDEDVGLVAEVGVVAEVGAVSNGLASFEEVGQLELLMRR